MKHKVNRAEYFCAVVSLLKVMNLLKRIKTENIKEKYFLEIAFNELTANQPNVIVAPNGYGKSTITTAFKAATVPV